MIPKELQNEGKNKSQKISKIRLKLSKMGTSSEFTQSRPLIPASPDSWKRLNRCKYIVANNIHFFCHENLSPTSPAAILSPRKPRWHCLPN
jgi:hypothetical protein